MDVLRERQVRGYGQFCPVAKGAEVFAERWTPLVVRELLAGSRHFNEIHRGVPLMSRTLLSRRLRSLEEIGVVVRRRGARGSEYILTEAGREFAPLVRLLGEWGQRWFRSSFSPQELDVGALFWEMRRVVKPEEFPPGRVAVQFEFPEQPAPRRNWWIVSEGGQVDLCPSDPGYAIDLYVTADLKTFARVWAGALALKAAVAAGKIELEGSRIFRERFERWLGLSCFAQTKSPVQAA
jgi:DNA-binding HxlR family transcriptional regulator